MTKPGCAFCAIAAGTAEAHRVAEDEQAVAFLDVRPVFPGHVLVVPREHADDFDVLPPEALGPVFGLAQRVARAQEAALGAGGAFVALNHRISQSVPHLHVHVVPRRKGDGLRGFFWPRQKYTAGEAEDIAAKIRAALPQR